MRNKTQSLLHLGILISGRGSNMEAILKAIKKQMIPIKPSIVISNRPDAKGLRIAEKLGIKTQVIESKNFRGNRTDYDKKIITSLAKNGVTEKNGLVCLAGYMRIISPHFIKKYKNQNFKHTSCHTCQHFQGLMPKNKQYNSVQKFLGVQCMLLMRELIQVQ